jgi:hypothetical protein
VADRSEKLDLLGAALAKAQAQVRGAKKDSSNPFFKNSYADLSSVWEACREALTANGLSVIQFPGFELHESADTKTQVAVASLETILLHSSGQWISGTAAAPIAKQDAQGVGSVITYLRRYALAAVASVSPEDDDGNAASQKKTERGGAITRPVATGAGRGPGVEGAAPTVPPHIASQPLSEKPIALKEPDEPRVWPYGKDDKGRLLASFSSEQLVAKRKWLEAKNTRGDLTGLMDQIDQVLSERDGVVS